MKRTVILIFAAALAGYRAYLKYSDRSIDPALLVECKGSQNELEKSFKRAVIEPAHKPVFFRELLDSDIFVIDASSAPPGQMAVRGTLMGGGHIALATVKIGGETFLPFFSSLQRLEDASLVYPAPFIRMKARELFTTMRVSSLSLLLNPDTDCGGEFTPERIASVLAEYGPPIPSNSPNQAGRPN